MKKRRQRIPFVYSSVIIIAMFATMFIGCEPEEKIVTETEYDTTYVTEYDTTYVDVVVNIISVDAIVASPDSITVGGSIDLTAEVSTQQDVGDLTLYWYSNQGSFDSETGDTVTWKAPDEAGTYKVVVHVANATDTSIAIGSRNIGVGMYAATVDPYYIGEENCVCHSAMQTSWAETGHANAWETLMSSDYAASYCFPCHTVGYEGENGNSGYDEAPIAKFENVQCENCHGAGSDHYDTQDPADISSNLTPEECATCHEGAHHPFYEEWLTSGHNFDPTVAAHGAGSRSYCQPCHSGAGFVEAYDSEHEGLWQTMSDAGTLPGITCSVCHDPHSEDNAHQLRTTAAVTFVENGYDSDGVNPETVDLGGPGQLCMQCHSARRAPEGPNDTQISEGYEHFGPHGSGQGDMVYGESGYEAINQDFTFASSGHGLIEDACAACHVNTIPYGTFEPDSAYVGHSFAPKVEACASCHGTITGFNDIMAKSDFDGDGSIEGIQSEVAGLWAVLVTELVEYDEANGGVYMGGDPNMDVHAAIDSVANTYLDSSAAVAVELRKAGYALAQTVEDGSSGVHNPTYAIQLLQQSILYLDNTALPSSAIHRDEKATTFRGQLALK